MLQRKIDVFSCDLCGSDDAVEVPHAREYTNDQPIHICKQCGFVYVKNRRNATDIADTWSDELYDSHYTARIPAVKARQTYVAEFIDVNIELKKKNICDIGGGEGQFLEIVKNQYNANVFSIEPSRKNCAKLIEMGFDCFNGTIEDYCASSEAKKYKADIVTIMWTLENCRSCRDMIAGAYDILKDGGYIVVATGSRIMVPFKKPLHMYLSTHPADVHCSRFSACTLKGILAMEGFEVKHNNKYLDSDILCMIAQKKSLDEKIQWEGDDYIKVTDFFDRWHKETQYYK